MANLTRKDLLDSFNSLKIQLAEFIKNSNLFIVNNIEACLSLNDVSIENAKSNEDLKEKGEKLININAELLKYNARITDILENAENYKKVIDEAIDDLASEREVSDEELNDYEATFKKLLDYFRHNNSEVHKISIDSTVFNNDACDIRNKIDINIERKIVNDILDSFKRLRYEIEKMCRVLILRDIDINSLICQIQDSIDRFIEGEIFDESDENINDLKNIKLKLIETRNSSDSLIADLENLNSDINNIIAGLVNRKKITNSELDDFNELLDRKQKESDKCQENWDIISKNYSRCSEQEKDISKIINDRINTENEVDFEESKNEVDVEESIGLSEMARKIFEKKNIPWIIGTALFFIMLIALNNLKRDISNLKVTLPSNSNSPVSSGPSIPSPTNTASATATPCPTPSPSSSNEYNIDDIIRKTKESDAAALSLVPFSKVIEQFNKFYDNPEDATKYAFRYAYGVPISESEKISHPEILDITDAIIESWLDNDHKYFLAMNNSAKDMYTVSKVKFAPLLNLNDNGITACIDKWRMDFLDNPNDNKVELAQNCSNYLYSLAKGDIKLLDAKEKLFVTHFANDLARYCSTILGENYIITVEYSDNNKAHPIYFTDILNLFAKDLMDAHISLGETQQKVESYYTIIIPGDVNYKSSIMVLQKSNL